MAAIPDRLDHQGVAASEADTERRRKAVADARPDAPRELDRAGHEQLDLLESRAASWTPTMLRTTSTTITIAPPTMSHGFVFSGSQKIER